MPYWQPQGFMKSICKRWRDSVRLVYVGVKMQSKLFYEKLHITKAPADTSKAELQHKVLNQYPRSCSDLLTAVINEVAMIRWVKRNLSKAPVSSEKTTLLSAAEHWAFDQQQIRLISASCYLHCPWFDTNFRIILPRFAGPLAGLSQPVPVNKGPAH